MRVAISGASGLVGRALRQRLEAEGHTVLPLVRRTPKAGEVHWSVAKGEIDASALEGVDAVVHLAGEAIAGGRWSDERKRRIRDSRVLGTRLLAGALAGLSQKPRVMISASAVGYYGNGGDRILTEESPSGDNFLAEVCRQWEAETTVARDAGIRVVNFRVGIVLAPDGGALKTMIPPFKMGMGGPLGNGRQWMSWIALGDIVSAMMHCVSHTELSGPVLAVSPEPVTQGAFARSLGRALSRPAFMPAPGFAIRLTMGEMGQQLLLEGQRCVPTRLQESGFTWRYTDLDEAMRASV